MRHALVALASFVVPTTSLAAAPTAADLAAFTLRTTDLPPMTGQAFAEGASWLPDDATRQALAADALIAGNHPSHQFDWTPISWTGVDAAGVEHEVEIEVAPDYLAVGDDADFLYAPLGLPQALRVARALAFELPTPLIVDRIYAAADHHFTPSPLPPTSDMRTPSYWLRAQRRIVGLMDLARDSLVAGHKKDVVLTQQLRFYPSQLAIYGWHRAEDDPIQPVSMVHGKRYFDYSHGIRAIAPTLRIDGEVHRYVDVLADATLATLVSTEGPIDVARIYANSKR